MIRQTPGKIFLAEERGLNETDWFRSINMFNFGGYQQKHKQPFGSLYVLNEDTLAGNRSLQWLIEENTDVILLPVVGAIDFNTSTAEASTLEAGMVCAISLSAGDNYTVTNPYPNELVKYLQLWIKRPKSEKTLSFQNRFDLQSYKLIDLLGKKVPKEIPYSGAIIKLGGRQEEVYPLKNPENGLFVYALQGALEVQNRLMHEGDGLALWDINEIEFEALSNDAILLIVEVPFEKPVN